MERERSKQQRLSSRHAARAVTHDQRAEDLVQVSRRPKLVGDRVTKRVTAETILPLTWLHTDLAEIPPPPLGRHVTELFAITALKLKEQLPVAIMLGALLLALDKIEHADADQCGMKRNDTGLVALRPKPRRLIMAKLSAPGAFDLHDVVNMKLGDFADASTRKQANQRYPLPPIVGVLIAGKVLFPIS